MCGPRAIDPGSGPARYGRMFLLAVLVLGTGLALMPTSPASRAAGSTLYVATTGADGNSGTLAAPLRTIGRAVALADPGATVLVRGGVYHEEVVLARGGLPGAPLTLANYPGETPIVDASMDVAGWAPVPGTTGVYRAGFTHLPAVATGLGPKDVAPEASCLDSSNDRKGFVYVDD